ncbi:MAG: hypothetical protein ACTSRZ_10600 [Promethearchaeota archaeon]
MTKVAGENWTATIPKNFNRIAGNITIKIIVTDGEFNTTETIDIFVNKKINFIPIILSVIGGIMCVFAIVIIKNKIKHRKLPPILSKGEGEDEIEKSDFDNDAKTQEILTSESSDLSDNQIESENVNNIVEDKLPSEKGLKFYCENCKEDYSLNDLKQFTNNEITTCKNCHKPILITFSCPNCNRTINLNINDIQILKNDIIMINCPNCKKDFIDII